MKTVKWIVAFCIIASAGHSFPFGKSKDADGQQTQTAVVEDQARELWMTGYVRMQEGKKAEDENNRTVALQLYREAADAFRQVKAKYPEWNPSLVQYRLEYVQTRMRRLGPAAAAKTSDLTKRELLARNQEQQARIETLQSRVETITSERDRLGTQVSELQGRVEELSEGDQSLDELKRQVSRLEKQSDQLEGSRERLRNRIATLEKEIKKLEEQRRQLVTRMDDGGAGKKLQRKVETLTQRNAALQAEIDGKETALTECKEGRGQLKQRIDTLQDRLASLRSQPDAESQQEDAPESADRMDPETEEKLAGLLEEARAAERAGNMDSASEAYRSVLEIQPNNTDVRVHLGTLLLDQGANAEAQAVLRPAFNNEPDNTEIYTPLGLSMLRQEKADMALAVFARGVALEPRNADFHRYLGLAARSLGWTDATEAAFRRSFKLDDSSGETAYNLALHYMTLEDPQVAEAKEWYDRAIRLGQPEDKQLEEAINAFMEGE